MKYVKLNSQGFYLSKKKSSYCKDPLSGEFGDSLDNFLLEMF